MHAISHKDSEARWRDRILYFVCHFLISSDNINYELTTSTLTDNLDAEFRTSILWVVVEVDRSQAVDCVSHFIHDPILNVPSVKYLNGDCVVVPGTWLAIRIEHCWIPLHLVGQGAVVHVDRGHVVATLLLQRPQVDGIGRPVDEFDVALLTTSGRTRFHKQMTLSWTHSQTNIIRNYWGWSAS